MRNQFDILSLSPWSSTSGYFGFSPVLEKVFEGAVAPEKRRAHSAAVLTPACDVEENDSHYMLSLDMPGIARENISIEVVDEQLLISADKKFDSQNRPGSRHISERSYGKFHRSFTLGAPVEAEKIEALYRDGVLRIAVPKAEKVKPKNISVKAEDSSGLFDKLLSEAKKDTEKSLN